MRLARIKDVKKELLSNFNCGNSELNIYLKNYASQNDSKNIAKTFVLLDEDEVVGYYSLCNVSLEFEKLNNNQKKKLPKYPIPGIKIARLAISNGRKGQGYGATLLKSALLKMIAVSNNTGVYFAVVDSKKEAESFYEHFGFIKLDSYESTYVLPISTIIKALEKAMEF